MLWYPSKPQWTVIWITHLMAFALWIDVADYADDEVNRLILAIVVSGALLVWMLARPKRSN